MFYVFTYISMNACRLWGLKSPQRVHYTQKHTCNRTQLQKKWSFWSCENLFGMELIFVLVGLLMCIVFLYVHDRMHVKYGGWTLEIEFATAKTGLSQLPTIKKCAFWRSGKNVCHEFNVSFGVTFDVYSILLYLF